MRIVILAMSRRGRAMTLHGTTAYLILMTTLPLARPDST